MEKMQTPLGSTRGLGSAKNGTHHWWMQKVTAVALIPLTIWFVASMVQLTSSDYEIALMWVAYPLNAILMILFISTGVYHLRLGMQVVIEDYVHVELTKIILQMIITFGCITIDLTGVFAILKIAL
jgi:succinate dehydrogenase / fumarate reductase membrane anchor subunit